MVNIYSVLMRQKIGGPPRASAPTTHHRKPDVGRGPVPRRDPAVKCGGPQVAALRWVRCGFAEACTRLISICAGGWYPPLRRCGADSPGSGLSFYDVLHGRFVKRPYGFCFGAAGRENRECALQPILANVGKEGPVFVDIPSENWVKTVKKMSWTKRSEMC